MTKKNLLAGLAIFGLLLGIQPSLWAATYTVTSNADSGAGTLRYYVDDPAVVNGDTIIFAASLPPITLTTPININKRLRIDGGINNIIIGATGLTVDCLIINSDSCLIQSLAIINSENGIIINGNSNSIRGCRIGTDWANSDGLANDCGIRITGSGNNIGYETAAGRNVISGNHNDTSSYGIHISGSGNVIRNNYVGLTSDGIAVLANRFGIYLTTGANDNTIGGNRAAGFFQKNVISGNLAIGVYIPGTTSGNVVSGNFVGTNADGTVALGNGTYGIQANGIAHLIGGANTSESVIFGNLISGNATGGLNLGSGEGTRVKGNWIGVNINGDNVLPNADFALRITKYTNALVGGVDPTEANFINIDTGNVVIMADTAGTTLVGNRIGVLPNGSPGGGTKNFLMDFGCIGNWIGLPGGQGNLLHNTCISLPVATDYSNAILGNTITGFGGKGIDLNFLGNNNKSAPEVIEAGPNLIRGKSNAGDLVELFLSQGGTNGSSLRFLGSVVTNSNNHWEIVPSGVLNGGVDYVSAIATDGENNSSEFSIPFLVGSGLLPTSTLTFSPTSTPTCTPTHTFSITPSSTKTESSTPTTTETQTANISSTPSSTSTPTATEFTNFSPTITATGFFTPVVTLTPSSVGGLDFETNKIFAFPMPADKMVHFAFNSSEGGDSVTILVYNTHYYLVKKLTGSASNGQGTLDWDVSGIAPGIYFYQAKVGGKKFDTNKLVIAR